MMTSILRETFDVLSLDPFFAAVVPMRRAVFIKEVIFTGKGSVASYHTHYPSSYQHYVQGHLVDSRALNGYIMVKAQELNTHAPLNTCAPVPHPCAACMLYLRSTCICAVEPVLCCTCAYMRCWT